MNLIRNERGVALLIAVFCISLIWYIVSEITYESNIEYNLSSQAIDEVRAYYTAKAGIKLSLLRIKIYQKIMNSMGKQLGNNKSFLDTIWQFPFVWPPVLPEEMSSVQKDMINSVTKESKFKGSYITSITEEGSKIDINLLDPDRFKLLSKVTKNQLLNFLTNRSNQDEYFNEKTSNFEVEEIINNIIDWIDQNQESLNGGDESNLYSNNDQDLPPNRPFRTIEELRLVAGINEYIYNILKDNVTIYGMKGINVNYITKEIIQSIDPNIDDYTAEEILNKIQDTEAGGYFQKPEEFISYLKDLNINLPFEEEELKKIFITDTPYSFLITSTGQYGNQVKEIKATVIDKGLLKKRYIEILKEDVEKYPFKDACKNKTVLEERLECECDDKNNQEEKRKCEEAVKKDMKKSTNETQTENSKEDFKSNSSIVSWEEK